LANSAAALLAVFSFGWMFAQTIPPCPEAPNRVKVRVNADVKYDGASGLHTYTYTVSSDPTSAQEVDFFAVQVVEPVSALKAPSGWAGSRFRGRPVLGWNAVEVEDPDRVTGDSDSPGKGEASPRPFLRLGLLSRVRAESRPVWRACTKV
jgi:hypothetical protein